MHFGNVVMTSKHCMVIYSTNYINESLTSLLVVKESMTLNSQIPSVTVYDIPTTKQFTELLFEAQICRLILGHNRSQFA